MGVAWPRVFLFSKAYLARRVDVSVVPREHRSEPLMEGGSDHIHHFTRKLTWSLGLTQFQRRVVLGRRRQASSELPLPGRITCRVPAPYPSLRRCACLPCPFLPYLPLFVIAVSLWNVFCRFYLVARRAGETQMASALRLPTLALVCLRIPSSSSVLGKKEGGGMSPEKK